VLTAFTVTRLVGLALPSERLESRSSRSILGSCTVMGHKGPGVAAVQGTDDVPGRTLGKLPFCH